MKFLLPVFVLLSASSVFVGVIDLDMAAILKGDTAALELLLVSRLPRLLAIWLAGAGLSIAGLIMQQISQNRFAAPSTTGTIECAMFGYVLSLVLFGDGNNLLVIFGSAMAGTLVFVNFIHGVQFKNTIYVPLTGIVYGNVVAAAATFVAYKYDVIQNLSGWEMANFSSILRGNYELLYLALPVGILSYWFASRLSAVGMGRDFSVSLGLNYRQLVLLGVLLVSVMSASVVMIVGMLPFLGLIVPNLVSRYQGDNMRKNIPVTALCGAILVLVCDVLGRLIIFPHEVPITMIISLLGGGAFIYLVLKDTQSGQGA
ncbi:iron chelate uptake ABC transporter family permease subunit [Oceanimonas sp. CHS3-5]|uniref:ABC transporter permease n=1 Tax=Oceanimonas sp. CHS3-5 TaxID=3068186 RepID=UPI00273D196C|nr:iron chelate uptake ABC transporter family permease subunit [Oceanimonas sp. CHS3-5]MDP5291806.1 iron chelate uptake ABC transporter family permease subunit [Oceanimonas sp. CHS3-5]